MQFVSPYQGQYAVVLSAQSPSLELPAPTDVTPEDVRQMIIYLRKAKDRAMAIRDRSPAGSYMESVLTRTIDGITLELSQLDYLLARKPAETAEAASSARRMRPAI
ncbi:hypothetical protein [Roseibium sp. MMSF_3544]|uniref:hypothetical protein n=1 Tax=unclassified Roseibium TaxID=2629323 RepID=UPI00273F9F5B|nr:hypothetical protein [Roseibium sp. MMSF_3544]